MKTQVDPKEKERLKPLLMEFAEKYVFPYMLDYLIGLDISTIGRMDRGAMAGEKNDSCLIVYLKKYPPKSRRRLIERYKGIRVYWETKLPPEHNSVSMDFSLRARRK
jgi:hypothetical protein